MYVTMSAYMYLARGKEFGAVPRDDLAKGESVCVEMLLENTFQAGGTLGHSLI